MAECAEVCALRDISPLQVPCLSHDRRLKLAADSAGVLISALKRQNSSEHTRHTQKSLLSNETATIESQRAYFTLHQPCKVSESV